MRIHWKLVRGIKEVRSGKWAPPYLKNLLSTWNSWLHRASVISNTSLSN